MEQEIKQIKEDIREMRDHLRKINGRVRGVENWRWMITGMGVVLSIVIIPVVLILISSNL